MNLYEWNEKHYVEDPFLNQLERLDWRIIRADREDPPEVTFREDFHSVVIEKELFAGLKQANPWIEDDQMREVLRRITTFPPGANLLQANRQFLELLLEQTTVDKNRQTGQLNPNVKLIDFEHPENNRFLAISQFKVALPGGMKHIIPDIILFVNGLPVVVVECKSPLVSEPMAAGVKQLMRYMCRRGDKEEGSEKLFYYNQIVVSTFRDRARYTTITGEFEHFIEWKDPYPFTPDQIQTDRPEETPGSQHLLIQGMLTKEHLLNIIYNFIVFQDTETGTIKVAPRYQQFRAVHKIIKQLKTGRTKLEKGGIIWHTQGSGKSLTMLFVARKLKKIPEYGGHKIIFLTNRIQLETQADTLFTNIGYTVANPNSIRELKQAIQEDIGNMVLAMVHKFREPEMEQIFPVLNTSPNILLLVDEAHIGYFKILGANLERSMPNAVKVAFSGTPTDRSEETFGDYIDKYPMEQAVRDEVTVRIIYEGRTHNAEVVKPEELDRKFIDVFADVPDDERAMILGRYTRQAYLEAREVIEGKARDMMEHYLKNVFPNKFKAQVVAVSREAAFRYKSALDKVLAEKIRYFEGHPNQSVDLETLKQMKIETVFAGAQNDPPEYSPYNQSSHHKNVVTRFKLRFGEKKNELVGDVGIVVVQNMLLLGFDAPVEQVMYLDRKIVDHNLLQAIARVNRVAKNKTCGYVVDYIGIADHLKEALKNYSDRDVVDIEKVFIKKEAELQNLRFSRQAIVDFFTENKIYELSKDIEKAVDILEDEEKRIVFLDRYKKFTKDMDALLPDPKALEFLPDLKLFTLISHLARTRYRDDTFSAEDLSDKLRDLVDEYLKSNGVDTKIPPIPIIDQRFVPQGKTSKAQVTEIESAIREHIENHQEEDPVFYAEISTLLENILREYLENWDKQLELLKPLIDKLRQGRTEAVEGLDPKKEMPFYDIIRKELYQDRQLNSNEKKISAEKTKDAVEAIVRASQRVGFWESHTAQQKLRAHILLNILDDIRGVPNIVQVKNRIVFRWIDLAYYLRSRLSNDRN